MLVAALPGLLGLTIALASAEEAPWYYFHSETRTTTADTALGGRPRFDQTAPTETTPAVSNDVPIGRELDMAFVGDVEGSIGALEFDISFAENGTARQAPGVTMGFPWSFELETKTSSYFLGSPRLPSLRELPSPQPGVRHYRFVMDRMFAGGRWVPLSVEPEDGWLRVRLQDFFATSLLFDAVDYPTGFRITSPAPTVDESPTPTATPSPTGTDGPAACPSAPLSEPGDPGIADDSDQRIMTSSITNKDLEGVSFPSAATGYAAGHDGTLLKTVNGGRDWTSIAPENGWFNEVAFADPNNGYAAGRGGAIFITRDGGTTWERCEFPGSKPAATSILGVEILSASHVVFVGKVFTPREEPFILTTQDAGMSWTHFEPAIEGGLLDVSFAPDDPSIGLAVGFGGFFRTTDGGLTWTPVPATGGGVPQAVEMLDADSALVGDFWGQVFRTDDGGTTWLAGTRLESAIKALDSQEGRVFVAGWKGLLAWSDDEGATWRREAVPSGNLIGLHARTKDAAYAVGAAGRFVRLRIPPPSPPAPETTYYLHPGSSDAALDNAGTFTTTAPDGATKVAVDVPGARATSPSDGLDPTWTGEIDGRIDTLRLDLWQKTSQDAWPQDLTYEVVLWTGDPGSAEAKVFPFKAARTTDQVVGHITVDLPEINVDPHGEPVAIALRDNDPIPDASAFFYGSPDYPSGFTVNTPMTVDPKPPTPIRCEATAESASPAEGSVPAVPANRQTGRYRPAGPAPETRSYPDSKEMVAEPATVEDLRHGTVQQLAYPVVDAAGNELGNAQWRVVKGTGNCCEQYVTVTHTGRIIDVGGWTPKYSDDEGRTWKQIRTWTDDFLPGGEGAVAEAPNGDVVAVSWDPYSPDNLTTYKYNAAKDRWFFMHQVLKTPFYDRPWLAVVDGPFTFAGEQYPYMVMLRGGWPAKEPWLYSFDGLNYIVPDPHARTGIVKETVTAPLDIPSDPMIDWIQPHTHGGWSPLPGGGAIGSQFTIAGIGYPDAYLPPGSIHWKALDLGLPAGDVQVDGRGWIHHVRNGTGACSIVYSLSSDGGATWNSSQMRLPSGYYTEKFDYRTNGSLGMSAIAIHAHTDRTNTDQDLVFEVDTTTDEPRLRRIFYVGKGDADFGSSAAAQGDRFDFPSIAIMANGAIVVAFGDNAHPTPALAILTQTPARPTSLTLDSAPQEIAYSDRAIFRAGLTSGEEPLDGEVTFSISGAGGSLSENVVVEQGVAEWTPYVSLIPGDYQVTVAYGGDAQNQPAAATSPLRVLRETTVATLTADGRGTTTETLTATLHEDDGPAVHPATLTFFADGVEIGTATTAPDGRASLQVPPRYRGGRHTFEVRFAGSELYAAAMATYATYAT